MALQIQITANKTKILLEKGGVVIADIAIADSSNQSTATISIQAPKDVKIGRINMK